MRAASVMSAAGTPVIAAALGAGPELVPDGETGHVVHPEDGAAFADIRRADGDPRRHAQSVEMLFLGH